MMFASTMSGSIHRNSLDHEWKLRSIEQQLSEAASQELRLEQQIAARLGEIAELHLERRPELEREAREVLARRDAEEQALRKQLEQVERTISELVEKVDARQADLRRVRKQVADSLSGREDFRQMLARFDEARARQQAAHAGRQELQEECARKLPQYRQDARYRYLVEAGYGTDGYRANALRRFFDGRIARQCNFHENRRNELTLLAMQDALVHMDEKDRQELDMLGREVAATTADAEASAGMLPLKEELERLNSVVKAEKKRANDIQAQLTPFARKADARYVQARSLVAVELKSQSEEELMARVLQTPSLVDDKLAREVVSLRSALHTQRKRITELEQQRANAEAKFQRAKELERTLRHRGYGRHRVRYGSGLNLAGLLVGYMAGRMTIDQAAQQIDQFREIIPDDFPYNHFPRDHGFGGGGFNTSDSFGGGDFFSTTDSF